MGEENKVALELLSIVLSDAAVNMDVDRSLGSLSISVSLYMCICVHTSLEWDYRTMVVLSLISKKPNTVIHVGYIIFIPNNV